MHPETSGKSRAGVARRSDVRKKSTPRDFTALERYLCEIRSVRPLGREEEAVLGGLIAGRMNDAARRLVVSNLRFVTQIAFEYRNRGVPLEDLISEGNLGLMEAALRFDPGRGIRFISYAAWWVRKSILTAITHHGSAVRIPTYQFKKAAAGGGAAPPPSARHRTISLDQPAAGESSLSAADALPDPGASDPEMEVARREHARLLIRLWAELEPREQEVLIRRFGLGGDPQRTLGQVGADLGLSRERVRQIQSGAIVKLKAAARNVRVRRADGRAGLT